MYHLAKGIYLYATSKEEYSVLCICHPLSFHHDFVC